MIEHGRTDPRIDRTTAHIVDAGLHLCSRQGLNPALEFLQQAGVPRPVALRVLCSPDHFRKRERRKFRRPGEHASPAAQELGETAY
jgi:hypothetical protein